MEAVKKVENKLGEVFKGSPKLSESSKDSLVRAWPAIALIAGALQLVAAYYLWQIARFTSALADYGNTLAAYYTGRPVGPTSTDKFVIYLGVIMLAVEAIIMLLAYTPLKARLRKGWDFLFLAALLNVVYSVVQLFTYERGVGSFLVSLLGSTVAFYLLFQVREKYKGANKV